MSLAIALLKRPKVLLLDEVTSGLDSASAEGICQTLQKIAKEENITIMCTIHQPSTTIFLDTFNKCIMLSMGRVAYFGETATAEEYFASLGYPLPPLTNPSEHYLRLLNSDFGSIEKVKDILDHWHPKDLPPNGTLQGGLIPADSISNSWNREVRILLKRHFIIISRDVSLHLLSIVSKEIFTLNHPQTFYIAYTLHWTMHCYTGSQYCFRTCVLACAPLHTISSHFQSMANCMVFGDACYG